MATSSVRSSTNRPEPPHSRQGSSTIRPLPRHVGHPWARTNSPKTLRETCCTRPAPPQVGQVVTALPGSAPLPEQCAHGTAISNAIPLLTPVAASASSTSTLAITSEPRPRPPAPNRSSPKNAEKRSESVPKSKWPGWKPPLRRPACPYRSYSSRVSVLESTS